MGLTLITPPAEEPITLAEAKLHCRVDNDFDDNLLVGLIRAARLEAERSTGRTIPAATWQETFNYFPDWYFRLSRPPLFSVSSITYILEADGTTQTVAAADYRVSTAGDTGLVEPSYDATSWPSGARDVLDSVAVQYVAGWPCTSVALAIATGSQTVTPGSMAAIKVGTVLTIGLGTSQERVVVTAVAATTFTATFTMAHAVGAKVCAVPEDIQAAMKLLIGHWYTNREEVQSQAAMEVPQAAKWLLQGNWTGNYL